jgi:flagellar motor component MotA
MTLPPKDRRGLGEMMAWTSTVVVLGAIIGGYLLSGVQPPHEFVVIAAGAIVTALARGTEKAGQRSASVEQNNLESDKLRQAQQQLVEATERMDRMTSRVLTEIKDAQIERYLPSLPPKGDH